MTAVGLARARDIQNKKPHSEETVRRFVPRIRDSALTHLRTVTYEAASDPAQMDHLRSDLMERFRSTGVTGVTRVLVTDLVVQ
jgi:hypothetical protein